MRFRGIDYDGENVPHIWTQDLKFNFELLGKCRKSLEKEKRKWEFCRVIITIQLNFPFFRLCSILQYRVQFS